MRQSLEYAIVRTLQALTGVMPDTLVHACGTLAGRVFYVCDGTHRRVALANVAAAIDQVYRSLPPEERDRATVLTGSYSQAAAVNVLREAPIPRAVSGHMSYFLWGPDGDRGAVLIAYGLESLRRPRILAACNPLNAASEHILRDKLNMRFEQQVEPRPGFRRRVYSAALGRA